MTLCDERHQSCVGTQARLATPHLMRNCGKRILSLYSTLYVRLRVCKHAYAIWLVTMCLASGPHDMSTHDSK